MMRGEGGGRRGEEGGGHYFTWVPFLIQNYKVPGKFIKSKNKLLNYFEKKLFDASLYNAHISITSFQFEY